MNSLERQLREDRAIRDAARAVVDADIAHIRSVFAPAHLAGKAGNEANELFARATEAADSHKGVLATLIAAIFIWFARTPIMALISDKTESASDAAETAESTESAESDEVALD